jgi:hypothetical protein
MSFKESFPDHQSPARQGDWEVAKHRFRIGEEVRGQVVEKSPFGAWIDLGVGFPALLEILVMKDLTPEAYRRGDWCPLGSEVTAFVGGFNDAFRQIVLWQVRLRDRTAAEPSG